MKNPLNSRRRVLAGLAVTLGGIATYATARAAGVTPSASEGPFYPTRSMRLADVDNDLVKVAGQVKDAGGEIIRLKGQVSDRDGNLQADVRVEIWQCDMNGKYMHPGDRRGLAHDPSFQGFGHDITDADGRYQFRTIKPTIYPGRAPHIHVKALRGDNELLTTQFYIKDHAANANDFLFGRMSKTQQQAVEMNFTNGRDALETMVTIVI